MPLSQLGSPSLSRAVRTFLCGQFRFEEITETTIWSCRDGLAPKNGPQRPNTGVASLRDIAVALLAGSRGS